MKNNKAKFDYAYGKVEEHFNSVNAPHHHDVEADRRYLINEENANEEGRKARFEIALNIIQEHFSFDTKITAKDQKNVINNHKDDEDEYISDIEFELESEVFSDDGEDFIPEEGTSIGSLKDTLVMFLAKTPYNTPESIRKITAANLTGDEYTYEEISDLE